MRHDNTGACKGFPPDLTASTCTGRNGVFAEALFQNPSLSFRVCMYRWPILPRDLPDDKPEEAPGYVLLTQLRLEVVKDRG